jgi:polar amino acid transport system substrate-binding protein
MKDFRTRLATFLACAVLCLRLSALCAADKIDDIYARGRLIVGVTETSPPFSFRDGGDGIIGYDIDLAAQIAKRMGVTIEQTSIINAERIPALQQDKVDLVAASMTRSAGRARDIDFSLAYFVSPHKVLVRKDSGIKVLSQLADRKLALVRSASVDRELEEAVPRLAIILVDDYNAAFTALRERQVDAFLADELLLLFFAQRSGAPQDFALISDYVLPRTAGFGIKKKEPRLLALVNQTLLDLEMSGEAAKIFNAWFAPLERPFRFQAD